MTRRVFQVRSARHSIHSIQSNIGLHREPGPATGYIQAEHRGAGQLQLADRPGKQDPLSGHIARVGQTRAGSRRGDGRVQEGKGVPSLGLLRLYHLF